MKTSLLFNLILISLLSLTLSQISLPEDTLEHTSDSEVTDTLATCDFVCQRKKAQEKNREEAFQRNSVPCNFPVGSCTYKLSDFSSVISTRENNKKGTYTKELFLNDLRAQMHSALDNMESAANRFHQSFTQLNEPPSSEPSGRSVLGIFSALFDLALTFTFPAAKVPLALGKLQPSVVQSLEKTFTAKAVYDELKVGTNSESSALSGQTAHLVAARILRMVADARNKIEIKVSNAGIRFDQEVKKNVAYRDLAYVFITELYKKMSTHDKIFKNLAEGYIKNKGGYIQFTFEPDGNKEPVYKGWVLRIGQNPETEKSMSVALLQESKNCLDLNQWDIRRSRLFIGKEGWCKSAEFVYNKAGSQTNCFDYERGSHSISEGRTSTFTCLGKCTFSVSRCSITSNLTNIKLTKSDIRTNTGYFRQSK